mmetsp:Transcript_146164/g.280268  ORF Transcript_146164/g.280268 Transcript_146164/m.280268 type:complete len:275 (+) Transcript_146164:905-1729(+)
MNGCRAAFKTCRSCQARSCIAWTRYCFRCNIFMAHRRSPSCSRNSRRRKSRTSYTVPKLPSPSKRMILKFSSPATCLLAVALPAAASASTDIGAGSSRYRRAPAPAAATSEDNPTDCNLRDRPELSEVRAELVKPDGPVGEHCRTSASSASSSSSRASCSGTSSISSASSVGVGGPASWRGCVPASAPAASRSWSGGDADGEARVSIRAGNVSWIAVRPLLSVMLGSAPDFSRICTHSVWPPSTARCSAVTPLSQLRAERACLLVCFSSCSSTS